MEEALEQEKDTIQKLDLLNPEKGYNIVEGGGNPPHGLQYVSKEGYKKMQENGQRLAKEVWGNPEKAAYAKQRMKEETHKKRMLLSKDELKEKYGKHNIGKIPPNAKPILQIDINTQEIIKRYNSSMEAIRALGLEEQASANIRAVANGKRKTAYGYQWRWDNK